MNNIKLVKFSTYTAIYIYTNKEDLDEHAAYMAENFYKPVNVMIVSDENGEAQQVEYFAYAKYNKAVMDLKNQFDSENNNGWEHLSVLTGDLERYHVGMFRDIKFVYYDPLDGYYRFVDTYDNFTERKMCEFTEVPATEWRDYKHKQ